MPDNQIGRFFKTYQAQQIAIIRMGSIKDTAPVTPEINKHTQYQILIKSFIIQPMITALYSFPKPLCFWPSRHHLY